MRAYMRRYLEEKPRAYNIPDIKREDFEDDIEYQRHYKNAFEELNPGVVLLRGTPGARLTDIIKEFMAQGVTPDLLPADLGHDEPDELDSRTGHFRVDPFGDIRSDPMQMREEGLFNGLDDAIGRMPTPPTPTPIDEL